MTGTVNRARSPGLLELRPDLLKRYLTLRRRGISMGGAAALIGVSATVVHTYKRHHPGTP
jgi:hypothetical protein